MYIRLIKLTLCFNNVFNSWIKKVKYVRLLGFTVFVMLKGEGDVY